MRSFVCLLLVSWLLASTAMAGTVLSLKTEATVSTARVRLSDISEIEVDGSNERKVKSLAEIDMGNAPLPGYQNRYSRQDVERIIRASGWSQGVEWRGAEAVKVERQAKVFDSAQLASIAGTYLRQLLSNGQNTVDIDIVEKLPELMLADGKLDIKPRPLSRSEALHANVTVWLDIFVDGTFSRSVRVPARVKVMEPTLVAKHDLLKGTSPSCEDVLIRDTDIASLDGAALAADCSSLKGSLKKNIPAGVVLNRQFIQVASAISHGDTVNLLLNAGAFVLESKAVALADGEIGQRIKVKPVAGTDVVAAIVVAPGVAKVSGN